METKNRINLLLEKSHLKFSSEEIIKFEKDFLLFKEDLKILDRYDIKNTKPLRQPFEKNSEILREDNIFENNSSNIVDNASDSKDGYIFLSNKKEDNV